MRSCKASKAVLSRKSLYQWIIFVSLFQLALSFTEVCQFTNSRLSRIALVKDLSAVDGLRTNVKPSLCMSNDESNNGLDKSKKCLEMSGADAGAVAGRGKMKVDLVSPTSIIEKTEFLLKSRVEAIPNPKHENSENNTNRRMFLATTLLSSSFAIGMNEFSPDPVHAAVYIPSEQLQYEKSPINKRSGVTVFSAEKFGYNVRFVTYLSRFLLNFDAACQRWWYSRAADIPRTASAEQVDAMRLNQFAAFSASVEVGLQEYGGSDGPKLLMDSLLTRYCPDKNSPVIIDPQISPDKADKQQRQIKEARRQIALLFGLMEINQPVDKLTKLLAAIDNAEIMFVALSVRGTGYAPGYGPPAVIFPPPAAGEDFERATGRATLRANGRVLRVDTANRGFGYSKAPTVTISPPMSMNADTSTSTSTSSDKDKEKYSQATAYAVLFRDGKNKGRIQRLQLINPGSGYSVNETISVKISPPELAASDGGSTATAVAILEYEVGSIEIIDGGSGYAAEKTLPIYVEPPPLTARISMNDPILYKSFLKDTEKSKASLEAMREKIERDANNNGIGGGGGCTGRACYDSPVVAIAFPRAEKDSYFSFNRDEDFEKVNLIESAVEKRSAASLTYSPTAAENKKRVVSGTVGGYDVPPNPFLGVSSSTQLLNLLPAGIGLEYNTNLNRYQLAIGQGFEGMSANWMQGSISKPVFPEFGPRGRSPIERQKELDLEAILRFFLSGAICCSAVHLTLTPIDVVKTKVQTDSGKYNGVFNTLNKVVQEEGVRTLFTGWAPTFTGFFFWGGVSYTVTEAVRRIGTEIMGAEAVTYEVPIILVAASIGAFLGCFIISPFETVRIRSVAQPDYADNILGVLGRMVKEEGVGSLFNAVPTFLLKEIPFAAAKFSIFDVVSNNLYLQFPAAREDLQLSLGVSLFSGTLGGIAAAFVSNPADATISEMKKKKSDINTLEAANIILDRGGIPALFKGLGLRIFFYSLLVSLQFFVYDYVRFTLGIGSDDLKLYLDVLGGALKESGGPA